MLLKLEKIFDEHDSTIESVRGSFLFYHYKCDGQNDCGWGCGYRTLQSLCSWIINRKKISSTSNIPSLTNIQEILVQLEDKPPSFTKSNQWIGTCEASMVLSQLYDVILLRNSSPSENQSLFRSIVNLFTLLMVMI